MKVSTGLKKLDGLLSGGFPENSTILLSGNSGTGKTLLALKYLLEGARNKEKCCYISLSESSEELVRAAESIKSLSDIRKYLGKNLAIEHIRMSQNNIDMKKFLDIVSEYPEIGRIVIDDVNKLLIFSESEKAYRIHLIDLISKIKRAKSSMLLCETKNDGYLDSGGNESFECDGIIQLVFLDLEEKPMRALIVHKMRYTNFDAKVPHELKIDTNDIRLTDTKAI